VGVETTQKLLDTRGPEPRRERIGDPTELFAALKQELRDLLTKAAPDPAAAGTRPGV